MSSSNSETQPSKRRSSDTPGPAPIQKLVRCAKKIYKRVLTHVLGPEKQPKTSQVDEFSKIRRSIDRIPVLCVLDNLEESDEVSQFVMEQKKVRGDSLIVHQITQNAMRQIAVAKKMEKIPKIVGSIRLYPQTLASLFTPSCGRLGRIVVVLDGVNNPMNIGTITRYLEITNKFGMCVTNNPALPDRSTLSRPYKRTSIGGSYFLPSFVRSDPMEVIREGRRNGWKVISFDNPGKNWAVCSTKKMCLKTEEDVVLVFGSEQDGISKTVLDNSDQIVELPMPGALNSYSVVSAIMTTVAMIDTKRGLL